MSAASFGGLVWLSDQIGEEPALGMTREALNRAAKGFQLAIPESERAAFCDWLDRRILSIGPRERSKEVTDMILLRESLR
jgi:hypothetical protein